MPKHFWSQLFARTLVASLTFAYASAPAAEWELVYDTSHYAAYMDVESFRYQGTVVRAWEKREWYFAQTPRARPSYLSELILVAYDCGERMSALLQATEYSQPNLSGKAYYFTFPDPEWVYVVPRSLGERKLEFVCEKIFGASMPSPSESSAVAQGTGFLADAFGTLITSNHLIDGAVRIIIRCGENSPSEATIISTSRVSDIAILRLKSPPKEYLSLAPARSAGTGTSVFTVGFPISDILGSEPKLTDGVISSMTGIGGEQAFMQISIPIQPGNSGGPVVNDQGHVVGIVAASAAIDSFLRSTGTLPQSVNWAVKSEYAAAMFDAPPRLPPTKSRQEAISRTMKAICSVTAE